MSNIERRSTGQHQYSSSVYAHRCMFPLYLFANKNKIHFPTISSCHCHEIVYRKPHMPHTHTDNTKKNHHQHSSQMHASEQKMRYFNNFDALCGKTMLFPSIYLSLAPRERERDLKIFLLFVCNVDACERSYEWM